MKFPIHDWQFWVVSFAALAAVWYMTRSLLPAELGGKKKRGTRTTLTVSAKKPK